MAELVRERYAQTLLLVATENNIQNEIMTELEALSEIFSQNKDYQRLLLSPVISKAKKHKLIFDVFDKKVLPVTLNFLYVLADNNRIKYIDDISKTFKQLLDKQNNIIEITATMAVMPNDDLIEKLKTKLEANTNKKVRLNIKIDQSILGGVILSTDSTMVDGSVINRLESMKSSIKQTTI